MKLLLFVFSVFCAGVLALMGCGANPMGFDPPSAANQLKMQAASNPSTTTLTTSDLNPYISWILASPLGTPNYSELDLTSTSGSIIWSTNAEAVASTNATILTIGVNPSGLSVYPNPPNSLAHGLTYNISVQIGTSCSTTTTVGYTRTVVSNPTQFCLGKIVVQ